MTHEAATVFDPQLDPTGRVYVPGSNLEVPGLEAILEYGDASKVTRNRIPGSMLINDHAKLDRVRITQIDGLHDDPDATEGRQPNADRHGEEAGRMLYRGRTVGLTGRAEAGSIGAMRNIWRRFRGQFGTVERDLLVHHPFEVRALVNEVTNPSLATDAYGWQTPTSTGGGTPTISGGVTDGIVKVGSMTVTSATGAGVLQTYQPLLASTGPVVSEWFGEDVWITVCIKVHAAAGSVSSLAIGLAQWTYVAPNTTASVVMSSNQASVSSPATGTWQTLTFRVPGTTIAPATTHVTPFLSMSFAASGTYTARFYRCACVMLDPAEPSPSAYFDGDTPGFTWQDVVRRSRSVGPTHAENRTQESVGGSGIGSAATYNSITPSNKWSGDHEVGSVYFKATKIATSTAVFGLQPLTAAGANYYSAVAQRIYRLSGKLNTLQKPAGGSFNLTISWLKEDGSVISSNSSDVIAVGEQAVFVTATAPARTCAAQALVQVTGSTSAGAVLEFFLSDSCFVDVTDWDPGDFYGVGDGAEEVGARRRIPRPFLLQKVRKTGDAKAPEQQTRSRAWRDFTMSLRASDPRIYCLDRRRASYELPAISSLKIAMQNPSSFSIGSTPPAVPTGATYEGQSLPATSRWANVSSPPYFPGSGPTPFGGVNLDMWTNLVTSPANPVLARFYRSLEGYTYVEPHVTAGCSPVAQTLVRTDINGLTAGPAYGHALDNSNTPPSPVVPYYNTATVLLKRVSSTTWLELRWNALSNGRAHAELTELAPFASLSSEPYAFELWCSHNASGTLATTRLAQWDYANTPSASVTNVPFNPTTEKAYLDVSLINNQVIWSLWVGGYPIPAGMTPTPSSYQVENGGYVLPSGLAAVVGSSVAGQSGFAMKVDNPSTSMGFDQWARTASNPPFVHHLRFSNPSAVPTEDSFVNVPVIGDSDTAPEIVLTGLITNPLIYLVTPRDDSFDVNIVFLEGTISAGEKIIIGNDKIVDGAGNNRYDMLQPGSRVPMLQPGTNYFLLSATDWDESLVENVSVSWRDALR